MFAQLSMLYSLKAIEIAHCLQNIIPGVVRKMQNKFYEILIEKRKASLRKVPTDEFIYNHIHYIYINIHAINNFKVLQCGCKF